MEQFISPVFEQVCRDFVNKSCITGKMFNIVGRWLTKDGDIYIIALSEDDNMVLFGESK